MKRILFVCTGNTCRSPMAEAMLRHLAEDRSLDLDVKSAGVAAWDGTPISEHAAEALAEQQITSHRTFRSTALNEEGIQWADIILTLTFGHKQHVLQRFPHAADKTFALKEYVEQDGAVVDEREQLLALAAELQLKLALGEEPTEEERKQLFELQRRAPSMDVADPFGGTLEQYRMTAAEIREALHLLLDKLDK
ncbi:low molecular weight protein arginine phosphatase [Paenibacillus sp. MER TA 81-3]|uniref:low molecular weight protein arginine phosphatase n=1 Tax=Paenibacillus sp. MER TA 81-3 TaxID=2939573 RepID=UPI00203ECDB2|nr:low molecular weight protein arginine phosphatase [Paenibacillus sp. MER TA 81-3]MCM3338669.1 low molecular weight protein arginine phosphatase [Paenibacillus sp. MER TA 81-3]